MKLWAVANTWASLGGEILIIFLMSIREPIFKKVFMIEWEMLGGRNSK